VTARRTYLTTGRLAWLAGQLDARDWLLLATLSRLRVATGHQLERLHFGSVSRRQCQMTLKRLVALHVLTRLDRRVGGVRAGSAGYVYSLDVAGMRLADQSEERRSPRRPYPVSRAFLTHALAVSEWYVRLVEAQADGGPDLLDFQGEPRCWRSFTSYLHGQETLKPDAFVSLLSGEWEDRWFLEIDRGTEHSPALRRQLNRYVRYWRTGQEQARSEVFPQVLWIVPNKPRHAVLVDVVGSLPAEAWPLFRVATEETALAVLAGGTP
jgi:hypothetical protein